MSIPSPKGCLLLIAFFDPHVVVPLSKVYLGEDLGLS